MHRLDETLQADFHELREDVQRSISGYPLKGATRVQLLLGAGGGFRQFGLQQAFVKPPENETSQ